MRLWIIYVMVFGGPTKQVWLSNVLNCKLYEQFNSINDNYIINCTIIL